MPFSAFLLCSLVCVLFVVMIKKEVEARHFLFFLTSLKQRLEFRKKSNSTLKDFSLS